MEATRAMEATGQVRLNAPPDAVWRAMRAPEVLRACVPGCQAVTPESEHDYRMDLDGTWGPLRARFHVHVRIEDVAGLSDGYPDSYRLRAQGEGALGLAAGHSDVRLTPAEGGGTILAYTAAGEPDSALARFGNPLLKRAARKLSDKFFRRFAQALETRGG
jgi:carbon monoxide dehydrogenase subunit G